MATYQNKSGEKLEISDAEIKQYYGGDVNKLYNSGYTLVGSTAAAPVSSSPAPVGGTTLTYNNETRKYEASPTIASPQSVTDQNSANAFINQDQDALINSGITDPAIRKSTRTIEEIVQNIQDTATGGASAPAAPNYEQKLTDLRSKQGVDSLETELNELTKQEQDYEAQARQLEAKNRFGTNSQVDQSVIEGRVSEDTRAMRENLDFVRRQKSYLTSELQTKYNVINNIMKYAEMDYTAAKEKYDSDFSKNLSLISAAGTIAEREKSAQDKEIDNARANLQTIVNSITSGGMTYDSLSADQKILIAKLETQSGLPVGFVQSLQNKNPKAEIISTSTRTDSSGNKYADVITKDPVTGALKSSSILLGKERIPDSSNPDKLTEAELLRSATSKVAKQLSAVAGSDGYIAPENYRKARSAWVSAGFASEDFDKAFASYANPTHIADYDLIKSRGDNTTW